MDGESKTKRGAQLFALRKLHFNSTTIKSKSIAGSVLKSVLRAIDDHGAICWASAATIASETCLGERSVFYALEALKTLGYISIDARPGRTRPTRELVGKIAWRSRKTALTKQIW